MKKQVLLISAVILLVFPSACLASYIIELNNGHKFVTTKWWKEGAYIKFYLYGGVVGLDRYTIRKIETSDFQATQAPPPTKRVEPEKDSDKKGAAPDKNEKPQEKKTIVDPGQEQLLRMEKKRVGEKYSSAKSTFVKAKQSGDKKALNEARKKLSQVQREIDSVRNKVRETYGRELPEWWEGL